MALFHCLLRGPSSALPLPVPPRSIAPPGDYEAESGCTRNFELWREKEKVRPPPHSRDHTLTSVHTLHSRLHTLHIRVHSPTSLRLSHLGERPRPCQVEKEMEEAKEADAEGDTMRQLENKTMDSKIGITTHCTRSDCLHCPSWLKTMPCVFPLPFVANTPPSP